LTFDNDLRLTAEDGDVLRCSVCHEVVLRVVETLHVRNLDALGAA
jgi:hypothetical protein